MIKDEAVLVVTVFVRYDSNISFSSKFEYDALRDEDTVHQNDNLWLPLFEISLASLYHDTSSFHNLAI